MKRLLIPIASAALAACSAQPPPPLAPPAPIAASPADGALHVALAWNVPVDLDLYVTDPAGETLYFANTPTRAGAQLEQDARCGTMTVPVLERARLPAAAPGRYRIGVDFIDACGTTSGPVPFRVAVDRGPVRREAAGVASLNDFKVIVLEFELTDDGLR